MLLLRCLLFCLLGLAIVYAQRKEEIILAELKASYPVYLCYQDSLSQILMPGYSEIFIEGINYMNTEVSLSEEDPMMFFYKLIMVFCVPGTHNPPLGHPGKFVTADLTWLGDLATKYGKQGVSEEKSIIDPDETESFSLHSEPLEIRKKKFSEMNVKTLSFIDMIKCFEDIDGLSGLNKQDGKFYPYSAHEANLKGEALIRQNAECAKTGTGNCDFGYGHKLTDVEKRTRKFGNIPLFGATDNDREQILIEDIQIKQNNLANIIKKNKEWTVEHKTYKYESGWDELSPQQKEILVDYLYTGTGPIKFPKFFQAVVAGDWDTARREYVRHNHQKEPLGRNKYIFEKYLHNKDKDEL